MTETNGAAGSGFAADGDPVKQLLLGFATQIDQLAGLIGGVGTGQTASPVPELLGELGTLVTELGDLLARILAAFIAVLEALAQALRSDGSAETTPASHFQHIAVTINQTGN